MSVASAAPAATSGTRAGMFQRRRPDDHKQEDGLHPYGDGDGQTKPSAECGSHRTS